MLIDVIHSLRIQYLLRWYDWTLKAYISVSLLTFSKGMWTHNECYTMLHLYPMKNDPLLTYIHGVVGCPDRTKPLVPEVGHDPNKAPGTTWGTT